MVAWGSWVCALCAVGATVTRIYYLRHQTLFLLVSLPSLAFMGRSKLQGQPSCQKRSQDPCTC